MVQRLRSLRFTAELDADGYSRGAQQKVAADRAMIDSAREFGTSLAASDQALSKMPAGMARLSRMYVTGYTEAEKFERAVRQVDKAWGEGMSQAPDGLQRTLAMLGAIEDKFGRNISEVAAFKTELSAMVPLVAKLEAIKSQSALRLDARAYIADQSAAYAAGNQFRAGIDTRTGVDRIGPDYAKSADSAEAYQAELERLKPPHRGFVPHNWNLIVLWYWVLSTPPNIPSLWKPRVPLTRMTAATTSMQVVKT
jgi:hypothetical protein